MGEYLRKINNKKYHMVISKTFILLHVFTFNFEQVFCPIEDTDSINLEFTRFSEQYLHKYFSNFDFFLLIDAFDAVEQSLKTFGYDSFRFGQHEVMARIVSGINFVLFPA